VKQRSDERSVAACHLQHGAAALLAVALLLAAPYAERAIPSHVTRVEDPEPLPDAPRGLVTPVTPGTLQAPALPSAQKPSVAPDGRLVQPAAPASQPEHGTPPNKEPGDALK
jgi:hypothetical protein